MVGIAKKHGLEGWQGKELGSLGFSGDTRAGRNLEGGEKAEVIHLCQDKGALGLATQVPA